MNGQKKSVASDWPTNSLATLKDRRQIFLVKENVF